MNEACLAGVILSLFGDLEGLFGLSRMSLYRPPTDKKAFRAYTDAKASDQLHSQASGQDLLY